MNVLITRGHWTKKLSLWDNAYVYLWFIIIHFITAYMFSFQVSRWKVYGPAKIHFQPDKQLKHTTKCFSKQSRVLFSEVFLELFFSFFFLQLLEAPNVSRCGRTAHAKIKCFLVCTLTLVSIFYFGIYRNYEQPSQPRQPCNSESIPLGEKNNESVGTMAAKPPSLVVTSK